MHPAYRTGSSSEALTAARRAQLHRGLGLVLGVFVLYALVYCCLPGLLRPELFGGLRVGELAALLQVLVIAAGVLRHDRHARRHVEPLAQRVVTREPVPDADESSQPWRKPAPSASGSGSAEAAAFNAFDSARAFGGGPDSHNHSHTHHTHAPGGHDTHGARGAHAAYAAYSSYGVPAARRTAGATT